MNNKFPGTYNPKIKNTKIYTVNTNYEKNSGFDHQRSPPPTTQTCLVNDAMKDTLRYKTPIVR